MTETAQKVAYFSMEFALQDTIPNYYGGLGVLAADVLYSAADMERPLVGVSLIYHQSKDPAKAFHPEKYLEKMTKKTEVYIENRKVVIDIYKFDIKGKTGFIVPLYLLSTNSEENADCDKNITTNLYTEDRYLRLAQEIVLGVGGARALEKVETGNIRHYHMNEGHAAFLTLELLRQNHYNEDSVRSLCTFTTHTPISAGHDYFDYDLVYKLAGGLIPWDVKKLTTNDQFGMTQLAMSLSSKSNSVSKKHQEVCDKMFPGAKFENVTNGIYLPRWVSTDFKNLFDEKLPGWEEDPTIFTQASEKLEDTEVWDTKQKAKKDLIQWINANPSFFAIKNNTEEDLLKEDVLTITFARRCVPYKRMDLVFNDIDQLRELGYKKIQLIFASNWMKFGGFGLMMQEKLQSSAKKLHGQIKIIILPDYNLEIAKKLVTGSDAWLNNPIPPLEASGTSGMKAALNGGLNISIHDGWWIEGMKLNPKSGWKFGTTSEYIQPLKRDEADSIELYNALSDAVDCYYNRRKYWIFRMKAAISIMSFFSTHRVVKEYEERMWQ